MSRDQFEAWYMDNWGFTEDDIETLFERSPDCPEDYYRLGVRLAHHSWQAAASAIEAKCAALAAENAALKDYLAPIGLKIEGTPATDAYLAEVRAQGVEMLLASLPPYYTARADVEKFAAQLLQEAK